MEVCSATLAETLLLFLVFNFYIIFTIYCLLTVCGGEFDQPEGELSSPGYPGTRFCTPIPSFCFFHSRGGLSNSSSILMEVGFDYFREFSKACAISFRN
jgi:hypothetical protein